MLSDRFAVESQDVIGWTNEEDSTLISFNYDQTYNMRFSSFLGDDYPELNETVTLDGIIYPGVFSVAVEVVQR